MSAGTWHATRVATALQAHLDGEHAGTTKTYNRVIAAYDAWRKARRPGKKSLAPKRGESRQRSLFGGESQ